MRVSTEIDGGDADGKEAKWIHGKVIRPKTGRTDIIRLDRENHGFLHAFVSATRSTVEML